MAKLVVDSSVAVKWFVTESHAADAQRILTAYQSGTVDLLAPDLILAEIGNIAWKKHLLHGMAAADAQAIVDSFRALPLVLTSIGSLLDDAYHLAIATRRTVYDALYLALSIRENCPFVTADEKLVNSLKASFANVVWVPNWT
jgi:predicted nucleic acid-binding protein